MGVQISRRYFHISHLQLFCCLYIKDVLFLFSSNKIDDGSIVLQEMYFRIFVYVYSTNQSTSVRMVMPLQWMLMSCFLPGCLILLVPAQKAHHNYLVHHQATKICCYWASWIQLRNSSYKSWAPDSIRCAHN